jgi:periplasmic protein TonB
VATPLPVETPTPLLPTETPTPEPSPTATVVPSPSPPPALPPNAIPPMRTADVLPAYSDDLARRLAGLHGQVELEVLVQEDGRVGSVRVVRGVDPEVDDVVVEAARRQLAYTPATLRGRPIAARTTVVVGVRFRVVAAPR